MYKFRFKKWGFRKNMTMDESSQLQLDMHAGRVTLPIANGRELGSQRLKTLIQPKRLTRKTPPVGAMVTTVPCYLKSPKDIYGLESALFEVRRYTQIGVDEMRWNLSTPSPTSAWAVTVAGIGSTHLRKGDRSHGLRLLNNCCAQFRSILRGQDWQLVLAIFMVLVELGNIDDHIALPVMRFMAEMCAIDYGPHHPVTKLCYGILSMGLETARSCAIPVLLSQSDIFLAGTNMDSVGIVLTRITMLEWFHECGLLSLDQCVEAHEILTVKFCAGTESPRTGYNHIWTILAFTGWLLYNGLYGDAGEPSSK